MSQVSQQEWDEHILSVRPYDNQSQQLCPFFSILNTLFYQLFQHQQKYTGLWITEELVIKIRLKLTVSFIRVRYTHLAKHLGKIISNGLFIAASIYTTFARYCLPNFDFHEFQKASISLFNCRRHHSRPLWSNRLCSSK